MRLFNASKQRQQPIQHQQQKLLNHPQLQQPLHHEQQHQQRNHFNIHT